MSSVIPGVRRYPIASGIEAVPLDEVWGDGVFAREAD